MRLIDADKLIEELTIKAVSKDAHIIYIANAVVNFVNNQPTAYSVDGVVEELQENASRYTKKYVTPYGNNGYKDIKAISVKKAIEIVKQGGVSDDVCEWESIRDGEFIQNPHTRRTFSNEPSMQNVYCNTCGKKIKVVE